MSTTLRALLWETRPLLALPDNGLACGMPDQLGGTLTERRYAPDDAPTLYDDAVALANLAYADQYPPTHPDYHTEDVMRDHEDIVIDFGPAAKKLIAREEADRRRVRHTTRYDYDAHTRAMAGDTIIGTPVSDRPLWRDVLLNIAAGAGICGLLLLALTWIIRGAGL